MKENVNLNKQLFFYAVTDANIEDDDIFYFMIEEALKARVTCLQLRQKNINFSKFLDRAIKVRELCNKYNCLFIVNDNLEIAMKANADGIHVGQNDIGVDEIRKRVTKKDFIIGLTVHNLKEAILANQKNVDYLGVGAFFKTETKLDAKIVDIKTLKEIKSKTNIPIVVIGGLNKDNISIFKNIGIDGIAFVSAIFKSNNIQSSCDELYYNLKEIIKN